MPPRSAEEIRQDLLAGNPITPEELAIVRTRGLYAFLGGEGTLAQFVAGEASAGRLGRDDLIELVKRFGLVDTIRRGRRIEVTEEGLSTSVRRPGERGNIVTGRGRPPEQQLVTEIANAAFAEVDDSMFKDIVEAVIEKTGDLKTVAVARQTFADTPFAADARYVGQEMVNEAADELVDAYFAQAGTEEDTPANRTARRNYILDTQIYPFLETQDASSAPSTVDVAGRQFQVETPSGLTPEQQLDLARRQAMPRLGLTDKYVAGDQFGVDGTSFMDMPVEDILRLQAKMIRAGVLNAGDFRPGVWDAGSAVGMESLMSHAANSQDPDYTWEDALTDLTVNPNITPSPAVYLAPDPAALAEEARNMIRQRLGGDPEPWLVAEMTRELSTAYRAEWDRSLQAQDLQSQADLSAAPAVLESLADSASRSAEFGSTGGIRLGADLIFPGARTIPDPNRPNHFIVFRPGETTGIIVGPPPGRVGTAALVIVGTTILPETDTTLPGESLTERPVTEVQGIDAFSQVRQLFDQRYGDMVAATREQEETAVQRANMLDILSSLNGAMRR